MERGQDGRRRGWGPGAALAAILGIPIALATGIVLAFAVLLSSIAVGPCEFDIDTSGSDRDDCAGSENALVRATTRPGRAAVDAALATERDPNVKDLAGNRPLPCAAMIGNREAVDALLEASASPDLPGETGGRPIVAAVSGEGMFGNEPEGAPTFAPIDSSDRVEIVKLLAARDVDLEPALGPAVEKGLLSATYVLLAEGANPEGEYLAPSPLIRAVYAGRPDIVQLLLDAGADPNRDGRVPAAVVPFFLGEGHPGVTQRLQLGADAKGLPPLALAAIVDGGAAGGSVDLLLRAGADPSAVAYGRYTPLWGAVAAGNHAAAMRLRLAGAQAEQPGAESALALAESMGDPQMLAIVQS